MELEPGTSVTSAELTSNGATDARQDPGDISACFRGVRTQTRAPQAEEKFGEDAYKTMKNGHFRGSEKQFFFGSPEPEPGTSLSGLMEPEPRNRAGSRPPLVCR